MSGRQVGVALSGLLSSLGVLPTAERDAVGDAVARTLSARGHDARVSAVKFGTLHLSASAQGARLVRQDLDPILAALETLVPGQVQRVVVHTEVTTR